MRPQILMKGMVLVLILCFFASVTSAQQSELTEEVFFQPIETVITAGRTEQSIERAPATVTVISSEEIQASGAMTIPELLRFVPGVDVMSITSSHSEVNARGLNQLLSNKMLVLIDGRSVYFDFFGGTIWQGLPVLLNQIDRIEIVRSPGSALYGANAFSGVINIITKTPRQLNGGHLQIQGGEHSTLYSSLVHGDWKGDTGFRFAMGTRNINSFRDSDDESEDVALGNFYLEHRLSNDTKVSAEAGQSRGSIVQIPRIDYNTFDATTSYAKMNLEHKSFNLQAFWNRGDETGGAIIPPGDDVDILYDTLDIEGQHIIEIGKANTFVYGASYRFNTIQSNMIDRDHEQNLLAAYFQDEYRFSPSVSLLFGGRVDHHPLVGLNLSPRGSLIYAPTGHHTVRLSVGKAFRNPSFTDSYIYLTTNFPGPQNFRIEGEKDLESEKITTYEVGYMFFPGYRLRAEINAFHYELKDYIGTGTLSIDPVDNVPVQSYVNLGTAKANGFEVSADVIPLRMLKVSANYSYQDLENKYTVHQAQYPPEHKANIKMFLTLPHGLSASFLASYVGETMWETPNLDGSYSESLTDSHIRCDSKVGYLFEEMRIELFAAAYNLFDSGHKEHPFAEKIRRRVIVGFNYTY